MKLSPILVITIAITIAITFRAEAVPEAPAEGTFEVGNGTSLCSFQQCQCVKKSQTLLKISCDCTSQGKKGDPENTAITKTVENDREFIGKKILSFSNCTSVKLMDGSLESVGGLEEVELTKVRRIELESGAFSGQQLKHISVSSSSIASLERGTFKGLDLEEMHFVENSVMGDVLTNAFTEMQVNNLRMEGNRFMGKLQSHAFSMNVTGSAAIGPHNNFTHVSDGAFEEIKVGEKMEVEFRDNEIHRADSGALKFHEGRVRFGESLFTGLGCPCEGGSINGATKMYNDHIQRLLSGRSRNHYVNEDTFGKLAASLMSVLTCRSRSSQENLSWQAQASACLGCENPFCRCDTSNPEGFTVETVVKCDCVKGARARPPELHRKVNIGFGTQEAVGEGLGRHHEKRPKKGPFGEVTDISLANCDTVTINMAFFTGAESIRKLTIENVPELRLEVYRDRYNVPIQESESTPEPRNRPNSHGMAFFAKNVTISCDRNTFCGAGFDAIEFSDSRINYVDSEAFHDLPDVSRITFANVAFADEISTRALSNVTVRHFLMSDSSLKRIDHDAFDITVGKTFAMERTRIEYIEELALFGIRAKNAPASTVTAVVSLVNVSVSDMAVNALKVRNYFKNGGGSNITYERSCDCDMYKISGSHKSHKPINSTPHDNSRTLSPDTLLSYVYCEDGGRYIPWNSFDMDKCGEDHGHDGIVIPSISGLGKKVTLAIILGGGAVFIIVLVALICVCLCRRKPVAAPHLPIGGENEDEWEQVPFERVQSNREGTWMLREGTEQQLPRRKTYFL